MKENQRIRIAMFGHKRIPSREGGVEIVVEELAKRMAALGYEVTCYNRAGHHVGGKEYDRKLIREYEGIRIRSVPTIDVKGIAAFSASFFAALSCAFGRYDVVHIHAEGPALMSWIPKLFGKKVIVTVHGLDHMRAKWGRLASKLILAGEKAAVRYADEIIVLSENVRQYFLDKYDRQTVFIPNGISEVGRTEAEEIIEKWGLKKDSYVLFLGRIVPEKGVRYLLEAWRDIRTDKKLVIAGGGSDTDAYVEELKNMGVENVLFTGFVQGKLLEELYSNAYVYVLPSDLEGMPLSLLEAMSYGNCCLVSDIDECAGVVEDKALSFRRGDIADLRKKLEDLLNDEQMVKRYKENAAAFICGKYNWDNVVKRTLELYDR